MALNSKIIIIKREKTQEFLNLKPNSDAIEKANKTMEKYGFRALFKKRHEKLNGIDLLTLP